MIDMNRKCDDCKLVEYDHCLVVRLIWGGAPKKLPEQPGCLFDDLTFKDALEKFNQVEV